MAAIDAGMNDHLSKPYNPKLASIFFMSDMNKANNKVLMTIKESKKKSISQIAAIESKNMKNKLLRSNVALPR